MAQPAAAARVDRRLIRELQGIVGRPHVLHVACVTVRQEVNRHAILRVLAHIIKRLRPAAFSAAALAGIAVGVVVLFLTV